MGQYVYEQLIPIKRTLEELDNTTVTIYADEIGNTNFAQSNCGIIEANLIVFANYDTPVGYPTPPVLEYSPVSLTTAEQYGKIGCIIMSGHTKVRPTGASLIGAWLRIVYTSMPEEGGYYGYNEY